MRGRLFRFKDRASYKTSEVLGLFVISIFLGMAFFGVCLVVDYALQTLFGIG
jgi:hypothetical protein